MRRATESMLGWVHMSAFVLELVVIMHLAQLDLCNNVYLISLWRTYGRGRAHQCGRSHRRAQGQSRAANARRHFQSQTSSATNVEQTSDQPHSRSRGKQPQASRQLLLPAHAKDY